MWNAKWLATIMEASPSTGGCSIFCSALPSGATARTSTLLRPAFEVAAEPGRDFDGGLDGSALHTLLQIGVILERRLLYVQQAASSMGRATTTRSSGDSMYTRKAHATREAPRRGQG